MSAVNRIFATLLLVICVAGFAPSASGQPLIASIELAKTVPIADTHLHNYQGGEGNFKELLDRNNVQWAGGVGYLNDSMRSVLKGRYIAAIGQREFDQSKMVS